MQADRWLLQNKEGNSQRYQREEVWLREGKKGTRKRREESGGDGKRTENKAHQTVSLFNKETKKRVLADD